MKDQIKAAWEQPSTLEILYRSNTEEFKKCFDELYGEMGDSPVAACWRARLHYQKSEINWGNKSQWLMIILLTIGSWLVIKFQDFFNLNESKYFSRNVSFIVFPFLMAYFFWRKKTPIKIIAPVTAIITVCAIYINLIPYDYKSDSVTLALIHLPLLMWALTGFSFTGEEYRQNGPRVAFLKFNGDLIIMGSVFSTAVMVLSAITIGLFSAININIAEFYMENIAVWGLAGSPLICTYIIESNPKLVNRVSPIIAKVFSPLVLVTLSVYLVAIFISGREPFNDRDFLIIFNAMLISVMAIIFFSISAMEKEKQYVFGNWVLLGLAILTIIINSIALAAIIYRTFEWGITPNRAAVMGSNVLILINMVFTCLQLVKLNQGKAEIGDVENSISRFLPIYTIWATLVTFLFPVIFNFR